MQVWQSVGKALFDKNKIEELLVGLTADKVIEAYNVYNAISEVFDIV